ncbi:hypothetical protein BBP40_006191 [Aspergillus hancockii]|nr:hypothetical protein BBP40_006191 [Aspergillus hancockii]
MWQHYLGKVLFITGGSGFLGTALIYRLVTQAPIAHIYVLCRGGLRRLRKQWGKWLPSETVDKMTNPSLITAIEGDILKPALGLTPNDQITLAASVHVVIHAASSINLQSPLSKMMPIVVDGSERVAILTSGWAHLECFVLVSTATTCFHLYAETDGTVDVEVEEKIYPLRVEGTSVDDEREEIRAHGTSAAFEAHDFPFPYAYAKHLTERLLKRTLDAANKRLLIVRPSIIGPAQSFPYYGFCVPMSVPTMVTMCMLSIDPSREVQLSSWFPNPEQQANIDEVPVDVVVDRLLVHLAHGSLGIIHAVAGLSGRLSFNQWWDAMMGLRPGSSQPRPVWNRVHWSSPNLHPIHRLYKVLGASYNFSEAKTIDLLGRLEYYDRADLQLFSTCLGYQWDSRLGRRQINYCIEQLTRSSSTDRSAPGKEKL